MHDCFSIFHRLRLKYHQQFHAHLVSPINSIIYAHHQTSIGSLVSDLSLLTEEQWLCNAIPEGEGLAIIAESADAFESKSEFGGIPIMLNSQSRKILERRRRKLIKMKLTQANHRDTTQDQGRTVVFLGQSLQNFTFSKIDSSMSLSNYDSSVIDAFSFLNSAQSLVLRLSDNFQKQNANFYIKNIVEDTLQHLIIDCESKTGSIRTRMKNNGRQSGDSSTSEAIDLAQSLETQIETIVREQMEKYKIGHLSSRTPLISQRGHRSVRDKAEQYLRSIRREWFE